MAVVERLRTAGFTEYEARAYLSLIKHGEMTARRLSRASGIPYSKTYEVVSKLEARGLVEVQRARPMIFRAVPPGIALSRYEKAVLQELERGYREQARSLEERHRERVSRVSEALRGASAELGSMSEDRGAFEASDDLIWTIRSGENVLAQMRRLIMEASTLKMILPEALYRRLEREIRRTAATGELIVQSGVATGTSAPLRVYSVERIPFKCGVLIADGDRTIFTSEDFETGFKSSNSGLATILTHFFEHEKEEAKLEETPRSGRPD